MMDFDCFKWDFVIIGVGNKYQDVYVDLDESKSDFSGFLCEEKIENMWVRAKKQTWNRGHFGN